MLKWIVLIIGVITTLCLGIYLLLALLYVLLKKDVPQAVDSNAMPKLRPIPIPTKNRSPLMRLIVWIFEVRRWKLLEDWEFKLPDGARIIIPHEKFEFDGASIPRPLWAILNPIGLLLIPGLIHDYGYKYDQLWQKDKDGRVMPYKKGAGKIFWDNLFREVGREVNGLAGIDYLAYLAVRYFGGGAWKTHRKENEKPVKPK